MKVSVIFTTYNSPAWLEKVLWGYQCQTYRDFEIIIADDGSGDATKTLVHTYQQTSSFKIIHVWHEDIGYRKCQILNKAILATTSEYLIFTDGDCIPRHDFVEQHVLNAENGYFLSGGAVRLPLETSKVILKDDVATGRAFDLEWLTTQGLNSNYFKNLKLTANAKTSKILNVLTPAKATWNGGNASAWKKDIIAVNGFDERMEYGGQDREFGERLINIGILSKQLRYSAICVHLDHGRSYKTNLMVKNNQLIRRNTHNYKTTYTPFGISKTHTYSTQDPIKISLIISVYKNTEALRVVLNALAYQTYSDFEIIISEDGCDSNMAAFVASYTSALQPIRHLTQPDEGWQKNKALNNAVRATKGNYLIFIDGDSVLHHKFIEEHRRLASPKGIVAGKRIKLGPTFSSLYTNGRKDFLVLEKMIGKQFVELKKDGAAFCEEGMYINPNGWLGFIPRLRTMKHLKGCNMSFYKASLESINGFDEDYKLPAVGEDADLAWRFKGLGFNMISARNLAVQYHLYHKENWSDQSVNLAIMEEKINQKKYICSNGLVQI